jgi:NaMN:DMB phosphoribosyltransferase
VANQWWQAAQSSPEPLHARCLTSLGLDPLTSLGITLEDGTGARIGLEVVRLAAEQLTVEPPSAEVQTGPT